MENKNNGNRKPGIITGIALKRKIKKANYISAKEARRIAKRKQKNNDGV